MTKPFNLRQWQDGLPLSEAWLSDSTINSLETSQHGSGLAPGDFPPKTGVGMLLSNLDDAKRQGLMIGLNALEELKNIVRERAKLEEKLKSAFLEKLRNREFMAYGYPLDAPPAKPPSEIPPRFFDARFFKWKSDIISDPPIEYRQVRITQGPRYSKLIPVLKKLGRPSDQDAIFEALKILVEADPKFSKMQRKIQSPAIQNLIKSKSDRAPSLRTISKSIPNGLARLKSTIIK